MLQYTRDTAAEKCRDLADEHVGAAPLPGSPLMTLGGVVNHMRWVEHSWIENRFVGGPDLGPWTEEEPDREFSLGATTPLAQTLEEYAAQAHRTDAIVAGLDLDDLSATPFRSGEQPDAALGAAAPRRGERPAQRPPRHPARARRRPHRRLRPCPWLSAVADLGWGHGRRR